ncbi:MAG: hypothetical protein MMC33_000603 [Icmadophila ericetorum]|nr:hypothetical protein [Icmadophila ericetorum]
MVDAGDDLQDYFINPPAAGPGQNYSANVVFTLGQTQDIQWVTVYNNYTISLWQQNLQEASAAEGVAIFAKQSSEPNIESFVWTVQTYNFQLSDSNVFYLGVNFPDDPNFTCHYFNISAASTTSSTSSTSAASQSSTFTSSTPSSATTTTPALENTSQQSSTGLSTGAEAGIGAGVGAIVLIAAAAGGIWWWWWRRTTIKRSESIEVPLWQQPPPPSGPDYKNDSPKQGENIALDTLGRDRKYEPIMEQPLAELPMESESAAAELSSQSPTSETGIMELEGN